MAVVHGSFCQQLVDVAIPGLGTCRGSRESFPAVGDVDIFKGIPFAKPPVGPLRFQSPQENKWTGVFNATQFGHQCPQISSSTNKPVGNEDCLTLNIYRPSNVSAKLAVMVWIHGGAYVSGGGAMYDSRVLSLREQVLVVTINYRLGILGFFNVHDTNTKGNYGILDQIAALRWVKKNIDAFNGDPNKVTIFGESAGSTSVSLLSVSPLIKNEGLFIRTISESGVASNPWAIYDAKGEKQSMLVGSETRCPWKGEKLVECMKKIPQNEILQTQLKNRAFIQLMVCPHVDKHLFQELPSKLQAQGKLVPSVNELMIGHNSNEGTMFVGSLITANKARLEKTINDSIPLLNLVSPNTFRSAAMFEYAKYTANNSAMNWFDSSADYLGDLYFVRDVNKIVKSFASHGKKVYSYEFTHLPKHLRRPWWKVSHALEIEFVFGGPLVEIPGFLMANFTKDDKIVSANMMKMWGNFAKNGSPGLNWPAFTDAEKSYLDINVNLTRKRLYPTKRMAFWNELVPVLNDTKTCPKCNVNSADRNSVSSFLVILALVYVLLR